MSFVDVILNGVARDPKVTPAKQQAVAAFLTEHRVLLEGIGDEASQEFFQMLYLHGAPQAWDSLLAHLDGEALLKLLAQTGLEMESAIARRAAAIEKFEQFALSVGETVLSLLTRVALAAL